MAFLHPGGPLGHNNIHHPPGIYGIDVYGNYYPIRKPRRPSSPPPFMAMQNPPPKIPNSPRRHDPATYPEKEVYCHRRGASPAAHGDKDPFPYISNDKKCMVDASRLKDWYKDLQKMKRGGKTDVARILDNMADEMKAVLER